MEANNEHKIFESNLNSLSHININQESILEID